MAPSGSHPYYQFVGSERRYPFDWHGGAGGVLHSGVTQSRVGGEAHSLSDLGIFDLVESGLTPYSIPYPAFRRTRLHNPQNPAAWVVNPRPWAIGDWPLVRPAGPEPMDPNEGTVSLAGFFDNLSDNERTLALVAVAGGVWWLWRSSKKRNPARRRRRAVRRR